MGYLPLCSLGFYDRGMIEVGSSAKVFELFSRMRARPDTFEMTLRKLHFSENRRKPRTSRLNTKGFGLERSMLIENMKQGGVVTFDKLRKTRRR